MIYNLIAFPLWLDPNSPSVDQEAYVQHNELAFRLNIQPESPILTSLAEGEVFATYHMFTTYSGLQPGWRLTISGSNPTDTYTVRGVERYNWGAGQHCEGTLIKEKQ